MAGGTCAVCQATAGQQCAGCKVVYYCGREHQRAHWPQHQEECRPVRLEENERLGRHLLAARNISAGELILRETPVLLENIFDEDVGDKQGPKMTSMPVCLGCYRPADVSSPCSGCGWPLCSSNCEGSPQHRAECTLMRSCGYRANITESTRSLPDYVCITPLRVLLMPEEKRRKILELQSHLESRRNTPLYILLRNNVVGFIRDRLGLADRFSEEQILEVCAILDTNTFEVKPVGGMKLRGIYPLAAMMAHDCRPNTRHVFDDSSAMLVYATVDIKRGDDVTTTYTHTLWGTLARRMHLRRAKCFDCVCARCSDPSELGTYLGAILCSRCGKGHVVSTAPLHEPAPWRCDSCAHEMTAKQIDWGNQALKKELETLDKKGPDAFEAFLDKYKSVLHPTNGHALQVKYALSQIYGDVDGYLLADLNETQLERKLELTHELLDAMLVLEPGFSRMRGILLFDLQAAMAMQAKLDFNAERITKERAQEILGDAMEMLQEATQILRTEPGMEMQLQERLASLASQLEIQLDADADADIDPEPVVPKFKLTRPPARADNTS